MGLITVAAMAVSMALLLMGSTTLASITFTLCSMLLPDSVAIALSAIVGIVGLMLYLTDTRLSNIVSKPDKPRVLMAQTSENLKLVSETPSLHTAQRPVPCLRNPVLSTAYAYLKHAPAPPTTKYVLKSQDGALFQVDVLLPSTPWSKARQSHKANQPFGVLLIYPGIGGHSKDPPPRDMTRQGYEMGFITCIINHRGQGTVPLCTPKTTTWGETSDMEATVKFLKAEFDLPIIACGFSMGGNIVCKYMGSVNEDRTSPLYHVVAGAFCFSNPLFVRIGYEQVKRGKSFLQQMAHKRVLLNAKSAYKSAVESVQKHPVTKKLMDSESIWDFDETQYRELHKESNFDEAIDRASGGYYLKNVKRPLLMMASQDDPCLDGSDEFAQLMQEACEKSPSTICCITTYGGHTGWYQQVVWNSKSKSDRYKSLCCRIVEEMGPQMFDIAKN
eukprot:m.53135 g.53135  ORF g.53135 m.53135 type:complete len:445 (-) comp10845_c0_seq1:2173-3507(-)